MDNVQWILAALLGVSLAASTGLNAFLPLLMLAGAARFQIASVSLNDSFAWLASDLALVVLIIAVVLEVISDKIPAVDHALHTVGLIVRPVAGALAAASVFVQADPTTAAITGIIIGAPIAFSFHAAKASARVTASATTFGCINPLISFVEDLIAIGLVLIGVFAPLLVPIALVVLVLFFWKFVTIVRNKLAHKLTRAPIA